MKLACLFLFTVSLFAQLPVPAPAPASTDLPSYFIGIGGEYDRYATNRWGQTTSVGIRIGTTDVFSYTTFDTPVTHSLANGKPQPSSIRTGALYIPVQSPDAMVSLGILGQAGVANAQASSAGTVSLSMLVAFRLGKKSNLYLVPIFRASAATAPLTGFQVVPQIELVYGFGGPK